MNAILQVNNLSVQFRTGDGVVDAVNGINFSLSKGQTLGIVGESGSGKSQSVLAMMGLLAQNGTAHGRVLFHGHDLLAMNTALLNQIRGDRIAMIFQDPMTSLNPYLKVERQMTEVLQFHKGMDRKAARAQALRMLDAVKIPDAARRLDHYPHEFSGGMRQRVMIAMALLCEPELLIADEPTTALDVTVQAQILALLRELQRDTGTAIIMITHDLGVVAGLCDEVMVMYGGLVMEHANTDDLFAKPTHPYTRGLLAAIPRLKSNETDRLVAIPGTPPQASRQLKACPFAPRCSWASDRCLEEVPVISPVPGRGVQRACHHPLDAMEAAHA
ncbi:oligopeptide/dipeptide ABC transporter ATP-binding protein [Variovorax sp. PCZ-1]|uniref:ABC transporter ATP-binding protein n=1 Tax=Variovorax sp. PCZ-1 TaxID=2835533 RepID=UPI001BCC0843|nr:oligopeptide/dipeptide ABC transporter ATP-binding protein [Variovorax sp. PCZ-1]MBS7806382.1 ATP-binding cassette domain-containing protein [Variovorax sp. PCZ-1]